jgi:nicotinamidase-related amidase
MDTRIPPDRQALLLIDLQNDYFPGGAFPLWDTDGVTARLQAAIARARAQGVHVVHIQHLADPAAGISPFFNPGTEGAAIESRILAAAPDAPVVTKSFADSFHGTRLDAVLRERGVEQLWVAGMMTQNCVTHTAISRAAEGYRVAVLPDLCTTVSEMLHLIALHALSTRVALTPSGQAF